MGVVNSFQGESQKAWSLILNVTILEWGILSAFLSVHLIEHNETLLCSRDGALASQ